MTFRNLVFHKEDVVIEEASHVRIVFGGRCVHHWKVIPVERKPFPHSVAVHVHCGRCITRVVAEDFKYDLKV